MEHISAVIDEISRLTEKLEDIREGAPVIPSKLEDNLGRSIGVIFEFLALNMELDIDRVRDIANKMYK